MSFLALNFSINQFTIISKLLRIEMDYAYAYEHKYDLLYQGKTRFIILCGDNVLLKV